MNISKKDNPAFILIVLAFCVYAGLFIFRTSFVIDGERYFSLFDDMMISMRYAKNFANSHGLVWNPGGERVEGYSNFLWTLYMSLFHLFPIPASKISLFIQISGALLLAINLYFVKKIADFISNGSKAASLGAVLLTGFYLPLNGWSLLGTEVGILTLIMSISLWQSLQCINKKTFNPWLYILLGISTFIRPDMVVPFLGLEVFLIFADSKNRSKNLIFGSTILIFCIISQTVFRMWYYGEIFPNTYYLKMTGFPIFLRITRGLYVFMNFIWKMNLLLFLVPFSILFFRRDKPILLLFWGMLIQTIYSIYVGGDAWENWGGSNRYLSIVMPGFFILFSYSLSYFSYSLISNATLTEKIKEYSIKYGFMVLLIISLIFFNSIHGLKALKEFLLINQPMEMEVKDHKDMVKFALLLHKITTPQATIAYDWAGTTPYFADRYAIDCLGKSDKYIAHKKINLSKYPDFNKFIAFTPGHNKYDFDYVVTQLKPDVLMLFGQFWHTEEAKPYIDNKDYKKVTLQDKLLIGGRQGYRFSFRKGSTNILWTEIERFN